MPNTGFIFDLFNPENGGFPGGTVVKNTPANAGGERNSGLNPGSGRVPGGGNDNPFQYSCLENSIDKGAWQPVVHGVAKSQTRLRMHASCIIVQKIIHLNFLFSNGVSFKNNYSY